MRRTSSGAEPELEIRCLDPRNQRGEPRRLEHVELVGTVGGVGRNANIDAAIEHRPHMRKAGAEAHVADRRMHNGRTVVGQPAAVVVIEPDCMCRREVRSQHAERVKMRR